MAQDTYTVYQIKGGEEFRDYRFESLEDLRHFGLKLRPEIYDEIYTGMVPEGGSVDRKLEKIYEQLNLHHPEDYRGHSLSVSDVVVLHQNGVDTAHFVESFGFMEVPSFQQYLEQNAGEWQVYIIPDLMTWATNAANRTEIEYYDTFDAAAARFKELRGQPYNGETALRPDGEAYARLTMGVQTRDNMAALDLLQVRQGQNYLVDDYTRSERVGQSNTVKGILTRIAAEIGFDRVQGYEATPKGTYRLEPDMSFTEWAQQHTPGFTVPDNPLRTAELSVEQNYNHIDGVFNNIAVEEQAAFTLGDAGYLAVQAGEGGWDYTFYNKEHRTVDGGQLDEPGLTMRQAVMQLLYDAGVPDETVQLTDYHGLLDAAEKAEQAAVAQLRRREPLQKSAERPSIREQLVRKATAPKPKPPAPHKNTPER